MKKQFLRVPLVCFTTFLLLLDLSLVIDLLNMGKQERSGLFVLLVVLGHVLLAAGWVLYFWKKPFDSVEDL